MLIVTLKLIIYRIYIILLLLLLYNEREPFVDIVIGPIISFADIKLSPFARV